MGITLTSVCLFLEEKIPATDDKTAKKTTWRKKINQRKDARLLTTGNITI
jgi:hypothetical protein